MAYVFFVVFMLIIFAMYVAIRRRMARTVLIAVIGIALSIIAMMMFSLLQGNVLAQALLVGFLVGGGISLATLAIAMYFQGNEMRQALQAQKTQPDEASA